MAFTLTFIKIFFIGLLYVSPILIFLLLVILLLGWFVGRVERWSHLNSFYYAFITATTVGYGDLPPRQPISKILAVIIAFTGLIYTGIVVAIALHALTIAFANSDRGLQIETERTIGITSGH